MSGKAIAALIVYGVAIILVLIFLVPYTLFVYEVSRLGFIRGFKKGVKELPRDLRRELVHRLKEVTSVKYIIRTISRALGSYGVQEWMKIQF